MAAPIGARIDVQQILKEIGIEPCALSDHAAVSLTLNVPTQPKAPQPWRLKTTLLLRPEVVAQIQKAIFSFLDINDTADIPISLLWETLKAVIRGEFIVIPAADKTRRQKRAQLQLEVTELQRIHKRTGARGSGECSVQPGLN
ncbi:hypothetical protein NDU88_001989 [Pleurodeles waltl]|uniref:Uncharacterized protein n=1 Tax=Pleurodeles waltl TaxID=8319 RepID=A0AAV7R8T9_PLEWA|nr:hypothetical protein NDU88_001989 [Pleurodeles waltl]